MRKEECVSTPFFYFADLDVIRLKKYLTFYPKYSTIFIVKRKEKKDEKF